MTFVRTGYLSQLFAYLLAISGIKNIIFYHTWRPIILLIRIAKLTVLLNQCYWLLPFWSFHLVCILSQSCQSFKRINELWKVKKSSDKCWEKDTEQTNTKMSWWDFSEIKYIWSIASWSDPDTWLSLSEPCWSDEKTNVDK